MDVISCFFCLEISCLLLLALVAFTCQVSAVTRILRSLLSSKNLVNHFERMEGSMQNSLEKLRPLVGATARNCWDYCVLWRLNEDQRSLKWMGCCCGGTELMEENGTEEFSFGSCRDVMFHHPRTKSCEFLSHLPSSIPLDSGIYAETLLTNQTGWLSESSEPNFLQETICTRVLIPIPGGLVELFATRHVAEDQNVVDFVMGQCNVLMDETVRINMMVAAADEVESKPYGQKVVGSSKDEEMMMNLPSPYDNISATDQIRLNFLGDYEQLKKMKSDNYPHHHQPSGVYLPENGINPFNTVGEDGISVMAGEPSLLVNEQQKEMNENGRLDSGSECSDQIDDEDDPKYKKKTVRGSQAKNLMAERRRRKKLNDRLYALRSLVPRITKLDRASILGDAINYVKELQNEAKELQDELEENSETEDGGANRQQQQGGGMSLSGTVVTGFHQGLSCNSNVPNVKQDVDLGNSNDKGQEMEPQVDVAQLDGREFLVKVICEYKPGGFTKLMEALDSLGLEVTNANTTRYLSLVSNVFKVEKSDNEMVPAEHVKNSLLEITRNASRVWHDDQMVNGSMQNDKNEVDYQHFDDHHHHGGHHQLHDHQMNQTPHHHHHINHYHNQ